MILTILGICFSLEETLEIVIGSSHVADLPQQSHTEMLLTFAYSNLSATSGSIRVARQAGT
jgi:hypothetical protein